MKKVIAIILILAMLFSVAACGSRQTVDSVVKLIDAIGEVTSKSGDAIDKAQQAYDSLSETERKNVSNHIKLLQAHTKYVGLKLLLEVEELKASGKADEAKAKIEAEKAADSEAYWEYLRITGDLTAQADVDADEQTTQPDVDAGEQQSAKADENAPARPDAPEQQGHISPNSPADNTSQNKETTPGADISGKELVHDPRKDEPDKEPAQQPTTIEEAAKDPLAIKTAEALIAQWGKEYADLVSEDYSKIDLPEYASEVLTYKELAKVLVDNEKLHYTVLPKTEKEHWNNIYYIVLTGNWKYVDASYVDFWRDCEWTSCGNKDLSGGTRFICRTNVAFLGYFDGVRTDENHFCFKDKQYCFTLDRMDEKQIPSPKDIHDQIIEVYKFVKEKHNKFVKEGKITSGSTQYQIAKLYANWYNTFVYGPEIMNKYGKHNVNLIKARSAYGALIEKDAKCDGWAAAFQLMMKIEGITCYAVGAGSGPGGPGTGRAEHLVAWMLLDGKEYIYEHNMSLGLVPVDRATGVASAGYTEDRLQLFDYNTALKNAGLEYDAEILKKYWRDDQGNSLTKAEFDEWARTHDNKK